MLGTLPLLLLLAFAGADSKLADANRLQARAEFAAAEQLYQEALAEAARVGEDTSQYASVTNNIAALRYRQGRYAEAEKLYRTALAIFEKRNDRPNRAAALSNLGELLHAAGRAHEAVAPLLEANRIREEIKDHSLGTGLTILGNVYLRLSRLGEAEAAITKAVGIARERRDTPHLAFALTAASNLYLMQGRLEEALAHSEEAVGLWRSKPGEGLPFVAGAILLQGRILRAQLDLRGAERKFREALGLVERAFGPQHIRLASILVDIADILCAQKQARKAMPYLERAEPIVLANLGENHPDYASTLLASAAGFVAAGAYDAAERRFEQALRRAESIYSAEDPRLAAFLNNYATLLADRQRPREAEQMLRRSIRLREAAFGPHYPELAEPLLNLGVVCYEQRRYEEAEALIARSLAVRQQSVGAEHPYMLPALVAYARTLRALKQKDQAKKFERMAAAIGAAIPASDASRSVVSLRELNSFR